ncbi:MAG: FimB/Mfa2 family fimbrial subunit [Bacteroides sp.]|nr:FimB/Mfa2 family fimbrial subunit [Bacteroides sp.]
MKKRIVGIAFVILFLFTACIKEDRSDCPESILHELCFIYNGDGSADIFDSRIGSVDLFVFDARGAYVNSYTYTREQLAVYQGANLTLPQGDYTVVAWGNVTALSTIVDKDRSLEDARLYSTPYLNMQTVTDFDSLYYGKAPITVTSGGEVRDTVYFHSAHIDMEVYVKGLQTAQTRAQGDPNGWVAVRSVYAGYDFEMNVTADVTDVFPDFVYDTTGEWAMSRFCLFRFRDRNDIALDFYNGDGELVYVLSLQQFLAANQIHVEGVNEITVSICISFSGTDVHVSVAEWEEQDVKPVF